MKILTSRQASKINNSAVKRLSEYVKGNNLKSIILGISGGIDSSVVAVLGLEAKQKLDSEGYKINYHFLFLDCDSAKKDLIKAELLAKKYKFKLDKINLTKWYKNSPLIARIPKDHLKSKIAHGNIKCRLRMITLYHFAQLENGIYLDTDDLSEEFMGFWTRHGDEGDVKLIQHFTKDEVYDLGEYLGIPQEILESEPGDGLGVTDKSLASDQLGLPYLYTDYIISRFLQKNFNINGEFSQLNQNKFKKLMKDVAHEIGKEEKDIVFVLSQSLKTAFKRRYGDNVAHLLTNRSEFGLPNPGTDQFNKIYFSVIQKNLQ